MDESEILNVIKSRLLEIGYDYDLLSLSQKKQLLKIEPEISKRLSEQQDALLALKNNKVNIASVSDAIDITRKTIYNNDVLKDYIEYISTIYDSNYPTNGLSELNKQLNESKDIIDKMVRRDANIENLKCEIEELHKEIADYKDQVQRLLENNIDISKKLNDYENRDRLKASFKIAKNSIENN